MSETLGGKIFDYFTNSKQSISKRLGNIIIAFILLVLVDSVFHISVGIHQSNTLEKLKDVKELKEKYIADLKMTDYLNSLESNIISKNHPYEKLSSFYSSLSLSTNNANNNTNTQNIPQTKLPIIFIALSSCTVFILFIFGAITSPLWSLNYSYKNIRESLSVSLITALIVIIITSLLSLIPVIYDAWVNYTLYFLLQIFLLFLTIKIWDTIQARKKEAGHI